MILSTYKELCACNDDPPSNQKQLNSTQCTLAQTGTKPLEFYFSMGQY